MRYLAGTIASSASALSARTEPVRAYSQSRKVDPSAGPSAPHRSDVPLRRQRPAHCDAVRIRGRDGFVIGSKTDGPVEWAPDSGRHHPRRAR